MQTTTVPVPNSVRDILKNPPEMVVAFLSDGTVRRFNSRAEAPEDAHLFESRDDAARLSHEDLDRITQKILKAQIPASKNKSDALDRAWTALLAASAPGVGSSAATTQKQHASRVGNSRFELLYDFDSPGETEDAFRELPPQAQVVLQIMAKGGKKEYSEAELKALVEQNGHDLQTVQLPWRIFQYYRRRLTEEKLIKAA